MPEVKLARVTGVTLRVEWAPVAGASYYTLIVREDAPSRPLREVLTIYHETCEVTDLKPATRYCVVLSAKNSLTQSAYSAPVCFTTGASMWLTFQLLSGLCWKCLLFCVLTCLSLCSNEGEDLRRVLTQDLLRMVRSKVLQVFSATALPVFTVVIF